MRQNEGSARECITVLAHRSRRRNEFAAGVIQPDAGRLAGQQRVAGTVGQARESVRVRLEGGFLCGILSQHLLFAGVQPGPIDA